MRFISTRSASPPVALSTAIQSSMAPDGGLYVPETFPTFRPADFDGLETWSEIGERVLAPFFEGDELDDRLTDICREAFNLPIRLNYLSDDTAVLELFHGPTAAFKDVGARFLAASVSRLRGRHTVLVATSGDTGGAVAAAFHEHPEIPVVILFPLERVSPRQKHQLTCWGRNVRAFAVRGDFDDCQRMVKEAFADHEWATSKGLLSANSINLGRLLPQTVYYAAAGLWYLRGHQRKGGVPPGFIVPTGNLGNAVAGFWARRMGLPVREVVLATNANHAIPDYFDSGSWQAHPTVPTIANAMDVGNPSNMERLMNLHPDISELRKIARAFSVNDDALAATISAKYRSAGKVWDPHTAAAVYVRDQLSESDWVIVSTAHPAKFESVVEPLIGRVLETPASLTDLLARPSNFEEIDPEIEALVAALDQTSLGLGGRDESDIMDLR